MFDDIATQGLPDDYVVNRMFELVRAGDTGTDEFAMLDSVLIDRLARSYPADPADTVALRQTAIA